MVTAARPASVDDELVQVRIATHVDPVGTPLSMPKGLSPEAGAALIADEALRWTYVLRSRRRWVADSRARERNEEGAREALGAIGVGAVELAAMAESDMIVVRIPYPSIETRHWESRILPWEYVLAAATHEKRVRLSDTGRARALTVIRELQRQPLQRQFVVMKPEPLELRTLFVECLPTELREHWSLESEQLHLRQALPLGSDFKVLSDPTQAELAAEIAEYQPQFLHFAGLDSHQGLRELRTHFGVTARVDIGPRAPRDTEPSADTADPAREPLEVDPDVDVYLVDEVTGNQRWMVDGVMLKGDGGYPRLMRAHELALALATTGHRPFLVTFNMWNTAARVAPLVVAEGAALASVGFQDAFDDALAEFVHATLYAELVDSGWDLPAAFRRMWTTVRELPESVDATGIALWVGAPVFTDSRPPQPAGPPPAAATPVTRAPTASVRCDIKPHEELNYAVLHNAQPLFVKFILECDVPSDDLLVDVDVAVHMGSETARYTRRVVMRHRREALTNEIHVPLTAEVARNVREAISSSLSVKVTVGTELLYCNTHRLRLLPVDQWRDNRRDGRWLPSFVQPRDPAVARALELAQRYNRVLRDDPTAGFEGYQLADPASEESLCGVDRQVEALWATLLHDWQLGYINPPPAYSGTLDSQRLRMPSMIREHRAGTCIDLALLFAACLELIDIYPVIFLLEGHALPGWWRHASFRDEYADMSKRTYSDVIHATATENSAASAQVVEWQTGKSSWNEVRRWIRERKLVPIETVRLTEHCSFVEAIEAGVDALAEQRDFDSMLDIVTARLKQVTPLPMLKEAP